MEATRASILLVDPGADDLEALEAALRPLGHELCLATSGAQAIELVDTRDFAVILLDLGRPDSEGLGTAARIRSMERSRETPLLLVSSGAPSAPLPPGASAISAAGVLFKPLEPELVRMTVAAIVGVAERTRRTRDEFLAVAAHELRTPVTGLSLHVQLARRVLSTRSWDRVDARLQRVEREVERLSRVVDELLDAAMIGQGVLELHRSEVDLAEVVQEVAVHFAPALDHAGCHLHLQLSRGAHGPWDRSRLQQVVTNLLSNALKYGRGKPVEIRVERMPDAALLAVRDEGIGIAPEHHARIFERFERVSARSESSGLGLGLWLVHRIVAELGGTVRLESAPSSGSTFEVLLPWQQPPRNEATSVPP